MSLSVLEGLGLFAFVVVGLFLLRLYHQLCVVRALNLELRAALEDSAIAMGKVERIFYHVTHHGEGLLEALEERIEVGHTLLEALKTRLETLERSPLEQRDLPQNEEVKTLVFEVLPQEHEKPDETVMTPLCIPVMEKIDPPEEKEDAPPPLVFADRFGHVISAHALNVKKQPFLLSVHDDSGQKEWPVF